jgi:hypothetical protein
MFVASWFSWRGLQFAAILVVVVLMLFAYNHAIGDLPGFEVTTQLVRIAGGISFDCRGFPCRQTATITLVWHQSWDRSGCAFHSLGRFLLSPNAALYVRPSRIRLVWGFLSQAG